MSMKYLKVFYDWPEVTKHLKPAQKGDLIDALVRYARGETEVESSLKGVVLAVFPGFRRQIDQDAEAYSAQTERNRENGKKGGRPKKETQNNPENPVGFSETQKSQDKEQRQRTKTKDKDEDKDEDLYTEFEKKDLINTDNNRMYACARALSALEKTYLEGRTEKHVERAREKLALPNDNWLHSERARLATAQHVVDAIVRDAMWGSDARQTDGLYDTVLGVLEDRNLSPLTIYMMATQSSMRSTFFQRMAGVMQ